MTKLQIVYDFDGVLIDSRAESRLVAFSMVLGQGATTLNNISNYHQELFELNRAYVRRAGELVSLCEWCLEQNSGQPPQPLTPVEFTYLLSSWGQLEQKERCFFKMRSQLKEEMSTAWFELHRPFEPLWSYFKQTQLEALIVTHKNKSAVIELCAYFGVALDDKQIFAGDHSASKSENFLKLAQEYPADNYYFIDDNFRNLEELHAELDQNLPIKLFYASWGYGSAAAELAVQRINIPVCSQEMFLKFCPSIRSATEI